MKDICQYVIGTLFLCSLITTSTIVDARSYSSRPAKDTDIICRHIDKDGKVKKGVSADYTAGVDINGQDVASANVNTANSLASPDPIVIPVELDLAERYGLTLPSGIELEPTVSKIAIYNDGRIVFNDKDISQKIISDCYPEATGKKHKKNANNPVTGHGQKSADPVVSSDKIEGQYPDESQERTPYNN